MKVKLIAHTPTPEKIIACAAKLCYSNAVDIDTLMNGLTDDVVNKFVKQLANSCHFSAFEHASFTFAIEGMSRAELAEITRHRVASFSVRSQRYCSEEGFGYSSPPFKNDEQKEIYETSMRQAGEAYNKLLELDMKKEDARMVLPNSTDTRLIVTMNVRELYHFFNLRCCTRAWRPMRNVALEMLRLCKEVSPVLFENAGASCVNGYCPEGHMCCGKAPTLDMLLKKYNE